MNYFQIMIEMNNVFFDDQKNVAKVLKKIANDLETGKFVNHTDSVYVKEVVQPIVIEDVEVGFAKFSS